MTICSLMTYQNLISKSDIKLQMLNALLIDSGKRKTDMTIERGGKEMKKKLAKLWQGFLIISIPISVISLVICGCCLDSESIIPIVIGTINLLWLFLIVEANLPNKEENKGKDKDDEIIVEEDRIA